MVKCGLVPVITEKHKRTKFKLNLFMTPSSGETEKSNKAQESPTQDAQVLEKWKPRNVPLL